MDNKRRQIGIGFALIIVALFGLLISRSGSQPAASAGAGSAPVVKAVQPAAPSGGVNAAAASDASQVGQPAAQTYPNGATVVNEIKHDTSPPLRDIPPAPPQVKKVENENRNPFPVPQTNVKDPVVQNFFGPLAMPTPLLTFEGISSATSGCSCLPPDTNGDVGPNNYIQTVNAAFEIWDKNGTVIQTARPINTIFSGFGGLCETNGSGDPIVLYDPLADRWMISQFAFSGYPGPGPYDQCIAISSTGDPTGSYHRYAFVISATNLNDYPKFGVWPDGYYSTYNLFDQSQSFVGPVIVAFDRARMLQGLSATAQLFYPGNYYAALLPADLDGSTPPPVGEPEPLVSTSGNISNIHLWRLHVDWTTPANSLLTGPINLPAAPWDPNLCGGSQNCIPQPGTAVKLDTLGDHAMYRLAYRNMGDHEVLLTNESVDSNGLDHAGVRWYEIRDPNGAPFVYQQGTYAPDADNRWMGSIAMDQSGDIAVGYSVSSSATYPSIRYAGRLASDPPGILSQGEASLIAGTGSQTDTQYRWGDYSGMTVDPSDDCTFWYTNEYYVTTSDASWQTRIGKFKFPGCGATTPTPTATGTPPTPTNTAVSTNTPTPLPTSCANYAIATGTATIVPGTTLVGVRCDDCAAPINLPFTVKLYDQSFTTANISSNGVLEFGSGDFAYGNSALPVPIYDHTIVGFWDDLLLTGSGQGVYSATAGTAPNRTMYLEWRATSLGTGQPLDFEIVLHENSNNFEVVYGTQTGGNGASATTGVERDMQYFTQHSYNQAIITPGLMLSYTKQDCPTSTPTTAPTNTPTTAPPSNTPIPTQTPGGNTATPVPSNTSTPGTPTATPTVCTLRFSDVPVGSTFYPFIRCLACKGIINGYPDGTFKPGNNVTRGQLSKIVSNSAGFHDTPTGQQYEDVPVGSTFYVYIFRLSSRGFINGYPCGAPPAGACVPPGNLPYFLPNANSTRGQISKIVSNAAGFNEVPTGQQFQDVGPNSTFYAYIYRLVLHNVMSGYPCGIAPAGQCVPPGNLPYFLPNNNATRGQTSKIVSNTFFPNCNPPDGVKK
jgi:hypothetical protein